VLVPIAIPLFATYNNPVAVVSALADPVVVETNVRYLGVFDETLDTEKLGIVTVTPAKSGELLTNETVPLLVMLALFVLPSARKDAGLAAFNKSAVLVTVVSAAAGNGKVFV